MNLEDENERLHFALAEAVEALKPFAAVKVTSRRCDPTFLMTPFCVKDRIHAREIAEKHP